MAKSITVIDACISGRAGIPETDPSKEYGKILSKLISAEMTGDRNGMDQYIMNTFHAFAQNTMEIRILTEFVVENVKDKELLNNILCHPEVSEWKYGETDLIWREPTDFTNLINPKLITLFNNVQVINMTINEYQNHDNVYMISLIGLLSIIESSSIKKVMINMYWQSGISWLRALWESSSSEIIRRYKSVGFDIRFKEVNIGYEKIVIDKL